jgi:hypothetical protein
MSLRHHGLRLTLTMVESVWWRRARWRIRGAWQWPAFAVLTAADAVLIARLPFQGVGTDAVGALLLAALLNLLAVALLAPVVGALVRRRRRDLPVIIARDYAGAALLPLITAGLLAGGLVHRSAVLAERADERAVWGAVHAYVVSTAPAFRSGLDAVHTFQLEAKHYRACVYGSEKLPLCFFVNTDQSPAGLKLDPSREPNDTLAR